MGMFDDVVAKPNDIARFSASSYQTKDLDCTGDKYEIDEGGYLRRTYCSGFAWGDDDKNRRLGLVKYTGAINIYSEVPSNKNFADLRNIRWYWIEFDLEFVDGRLTVIKEIRIPPNSFGTSGVMIGGRRLDR